jgi:hypothetical protein
MRKMLVLFTGLLMVSFACLVAAEEETIVAEGSGEGANPEEALLAAKRNAVEKGIGTILLSQTEIENFQLKRDQVITKTIGAVKSYEKISEGKTDGGYFEVKIKAVLSRSAMREDLAAFAILIESMNKPRTMVLIDENNIGTAEPNNSAAETAILQFLKDPYEFELIDPKASAAIRSSQEKMAELAGDAAAAAHIGSQNGAEVIITGSAVSREAKGVNQNLGGMVSAQADVTLRAINCTTLRRSILRILARLNPKKIVIASTAPQIRYPDCYGIDMSEIGKFIAFEAAVSLLKEHGQAELLAEVYRLCRAEAAKPLAVDLTNHVRRIYEPFTPEEISRRIVELVRPKNIEWKGEVEIIFQSIESLHAAVPHHTGDWYFTGKYPTSGGYRVVNQAYVNYYEQSEGRSY